MTNEQKIRNLAVKFFKQFGNAEMPMMGEYSNCTVWDEIRNSYGYGEEKPQTQADYIKRLKYHDYIEAGWLLSDIAIPNNDKFKFLDIETIEVDGIEIGLVKIGKQFFEIEVEKFTEYKPKKKIVYVLDKCND